MIGLPPIFWHEQGSGGGVIQVLLMSVCLYLSVCHSVCLSVSLCLSLCTRGWPAACISPIVCLPNHLTLLRAFYQTILVVSR